MTTEGINLLPQSALHGRIEYRPRLTGALPDQVAMLTMLRSSVAISALLLTVLSLFIVHVCVSDPVAAESVQYVLLVAGQLVIIFCASPRNGLLLFIMSAGLALKLTSSSLHVLLAHWGASDAMVYFARSVNIAATAHQARDLFQTRQFWGTELIVAITAVLVKCFGASMALLTTIYGSISFWGEYLYYLTFRMMFPAVDARAAAAALFLLPSIVFWPAALGKDALMLFLLGLASWSMARLTKRKSPGAALLLLAGVFGSYMIRPHIATFLIISLGAGFFASKHVTIPLSRWRRILRMLILAVMSFVALYACAQLLKISSLAEGADRLRVSMQLNERDGSGFSPGDSITTRLLMAPLLLVRPFPWEINGAQAGLAAIEGMVLAGLLLFRLRRILTFCAAHRHEPFMVFLICFTALNVLLIGVASSNFGLLVRERVMIYPPVVLLIFAAGASLPVSANRRSVGIPPLQRAGTPQRMVLPGTSQS